MLETAKKVLAIEAEAIKNIKNQLDENFIKAVNLILNCQGRIVVTGIGKSGLIGRKIASTLASTGTPAFFLHPAEGVHGDLGMLMKQDLVLAISYSGEVEEMEKLLPGIKGMGLKLITITGRKKSTLARYSDVVIDVPIKKEACPYNLVPTASTTATLALGDALAITLLVKRGFRKETFALLHPGGTLGRKLFLKVKDIMRSGKDNPVIKQDKSVKEALLVMTATRLGAVSVINDKGKLVGFFTDGDLRRYFQKGMNIINVSLEKVMTKKPYTITQDKLATEAARILEDKNFDNMPVVDKKGYPIGIIDERDLLAKGLE